MRLLRCLIWLGCVWSHAVLFKTTLRKRFFATIHDTAQSESRDGEWASTLTYLDVSVMRPLSQHTIQSMARQFGHSLRELHIRVDGTSEYSRPPLAFPKLEHLALVAEERPSSYLQYFCNSPIRSLKLIGCYRFDCNLFHKSLNDKLFPDLQRLDLSDCAFWPSYKSCDQMMEDCMQAGVKFELIPPVPVDSTEE